MRIISIIEDSEITKKILKHLGLWDVRSKPPARAHGPPTEAFIIHDESSSPAQMITLLIPIIRSKPTFKKSS